MPRADVLHGPDWERLDALLDAALGVAREERARWLDEACGSDAALRVRLETLLELAEGEGGPLQPGGAQAGPVWDDVVADLARAEEETLPVGASIGPYEIVGLLGSGGMGRVYRARDPRLGREVAIKGLAGTFFGRDAALRRFEREARTLAALSHPNIAAIYELLQVDEEPYLVLELVEGPTLADRLERGPIPPAEAIGLAVQVAEALEDAHRRGVVHRDLKPSNVKLDPSGRVKVLDFGLAKTDAGAGEAGSSARTMTVQGAILGTAPYMSPEQAQGREVDRRTDVWSFGCVLYEMLTGVRAFAGDNTFDILAAVLRDDVALGLLPPTTPDSVRRLLERCLRKDPDRRLQDMGDVRLELLEPDSPKGTASRSGRPILPWAITAIALLGIAAAGIALVRARAPRPPSIRSRQLQLDPGPGVILLRNYAASFAISPDGATVAFVGLEDGVPHLYVRPLDRPEAKRLPGTVDAWQPFFSPDGRFVAFFADRKLNKTPTEGGAVAPLVEIGSNPRGGSWGPAGDIVLAPTQTSGLALVSDQGGPLRELTRLDDAAGERTHRWPQFLPGGRAVLFSAAGEDGPFDDGRLDVVEVATGARRQVLAGGAHGRYAPGGYLVFARTAGLFGVPFDAGRLVTAGEPRLVLEGVAYNARNGGTQMALSEEGTLVYVPARPAPLERYLGWLEPGGEVTPISLDARRFREPRLSPDGRYVAVIVTGDDGSDAWVLDLATRTPLRLTFGRVVHRPTWTPDGRSLTVGLREGSRWRLANLPVEGGQVGPPLLESTNRLYPCAWSRDGSHLVYQERRPESGWDLGMLSVDSQRRPRGAPAPLFDSPGNEENGMPSPDGAWLAFDADDVDGVAQVYVGPFRRRGDSVRVTTGGGREPRWANSGHLYYWQTQAFEARRLSRGPATDRWIAGTERAVLPPAPRPDTARPGPRLVSSPEATSYELDSASGRILVLAIEGATREPEPFRMVVALGWLEELKARLSAPP